MKAQRAHAPKGKKGVQYHIGLGPKDVAPRILLVGDPARAALIAERFDSVRPGFPKAHREYVTYTGVWKGLDVTVMATGMGPDNTEIALVELHQCVKAPVIIRVGTCGALRKGIRPGDLVVTTGAVRLENTTSAFVEAGYPAVAHHEVVLALASAAAHAGHAHHVGLTATAPGFYGWQGRRHEVLKSRFESLPADLGRQGVLNLEMEASALLVIGHLLGSRVGAVCVAFANRVDDTFLAPERRKAAEARAIDVGLGALALIDRMDRERGRAPHWIISPST